MNMKKFLASMLIIASFPLLAGLEEYLRIAINDKDYVRAEEFLDLGADPNAYAPSPRGRSGVWTLLQLAYPDQKMMKLLIKKGAKPSPALFLAAHTDDVELGKFLIAEGADANYKDTLSMAVSRDHALMTELLLNNGADPNKQNGHTRVLMYAIFNITQTLHGSEIIFKPNFAILELLTAHKVNSNLPVYDNKNIYYYLDNTPNIPEEDKIKVLSILQCAKL